ncbi:hypothetical protein PC118_g10659 [Phytophthora cactorum]|uniref:DUF4954 domain-containing protein n=1 Tax=Phytophthora cactorum TaxID=29920 RepID=A0A8T1FWW9_9STRA|nr:hypothetical protein PC118_g10659 [Phytophthora cactorum]
MERGAERAEDASEHNLSALLSSDHVRYVQLRREMFCSAFYPLSDGEIRALEANGNSAENWHNVRKTDAYTPLETSRIRQCSFHGKVVLGRFSTTFRHGVDGIPFLSGVYNSALSNVVVLDDALVRDTLVLRDVLVDSRASIIKCGSVTGPEEDAISANGNLLHVGVETGGRDLRMVADLPFALGAAVATKRGDHDLLKAYNAFVDKYVAAVKASLAIVAQNARIRGCSRVQGTFVGEYAVVEDSDVVNSTILSTKEEPSVIRTKSIVRDSIVQWNSTVEALSVVEGSFLCDTSHKGKGNIGYGANVGSNHTLKAPDQELFHGEGVFFGLGCNVKFPSNFAKAPYSVIATAVNTLPQLVTMPFALINTPGHTIPSLSPAINEISPGWVLSSSVFTVLRNEDKFRSRNNSKRTHIEADIFRPEIIQYMKDARVELEAAEGKNYMRESSRRAGITTYTFFIKLYALDELLKLVESGHVSADGTVGSMDSFRYELATLVEEFDATKRIRECLSDLVSMRADVAKKAADGKTRDDVRGQRIIPDYSDVHRPADNEAVVLRAQRSASDIKQRVAAFVARV